ncbi:hypothetical protein [Tamlana crocina]|uniref:Lipoprotein n=1 Tax=Tamlana crocina TaxID=393006 RepID=A0ABX1DFL6_9FLAO|nr:hypothetical protein [Tamlana crocina]NJX15783.1 hypothetical protein [Tamlana crocina]
MRTILLTLVGCFILLSSCKDAPEQANTDNVEASESQSLTEQDLAKLKYTDYILDEEAEKLIKNSGEYVQLEDLVKNIKQGDLSFFETSEETQKDLFKNLRQTLPDALNTESVLARILVLETKFHQLESLYNLSTTTKDELLKNTKEFLVAFSNLNLQMNKKMEFDNRTIEKP